MPVFRSEHAALPDWCELRHYEIVHLDPWGVHGFARRAPREKLFVGRGACRVGTGLSAAEAAEGAVLALDGPEGAFAVQALRAGATLVRVCGDWDDETGGCGVFTLDNTPTPRNTGDPVDYERTTDFDNHYHDCDEYWILFEGRGRAVTEGVAYEVGAGDCVATGRGHHHDFPRVYETVRGVYFETTLEGAKRTGHLWAHTHGPAAPPPERR